VLGARRTDRLEQIAAELRSGGGEVVTVATDVTRRADLDGLVGRAVAEFGRLDVLVSNAGISRIGPIGDGDVDGWSEMIDVNVRGVLYGIAAATPVFRRQDSDGGPSSGVDRRGHPDHVHLAGIRANRTRRLH
jgi:NADP-dependent 3-hydroxy acid dehydrogenase YdfG